MAKKKKEATEIGRARLKTRVWVLAAILPIALIITYVFFLAPAQSSNAAAEENLLATQTQTSGYEIRISDLNSGGA